MRKQCFDIKGISFTDSTEENKSNKSINFIVELLFSFKTTSKILDHKLALHY